MIVSPFSEGLESEDAGTDQGRIRSRTSRKQRRLEKTQHESTRNDRRVGRYRNGRSGPRGQLCPGTARKKRGRVALRRFGFRQTSGPRSRRTGFRLPWWAMSTRAGAWKAECRSAAWVPATSRWKATESSGSVPSSMTLCRLESSLPTGWLSKPGTRRIPLSVAQIQYWGHYPVADLQAHFNEVPLEIGIRAFTPFIVGDAAASNTPAALLGASVPGRACRSA